MNLTEEKACNSFENSITHTHTHTHTLIIAEKEIAIGDLNRCSSEHRVFCICEKV